MESETERQSDDRDLKDLASIEPSTTWWSIQALSEFRSMWSEREAEIDHQLVLSGLILHRVQIVYGKILIGNG